MKQLISLVLLLCACAGVNATTQPAGTADASSPAEVIRRFVDDELARTVPNLRAEVSVGDVDPHLRLSACTRTEAFLRPGARLWGRSFVGYRCLQNGGWTVFVPVFVRLYGKALVLSQSLPAMQALSADAVHLEEVEISREPGGIATDAREIEDRTCTRALEPGQAIPLNCLHAIPAVGQGDPVKLVGLGNGFSISTDGTALSTVAAGELVRVRTESGHTVSGVARKGRVVEVNF